MNIPKLKSLATNVKVELDLSNYPTKADLKSATAVDASDLKKTGSANLKPDVDKLDILPSNLRNLRSKVDKLGFDLLDPVPVDISKLSDAGKNDVVKKDVCNAQIENVEDKIPEITNFATNTAKMLLNAKIDEVKDEIPSITDLAAAAAAPPPPTTPTTPPTPTTAFDAKINEVKHKFYNLATNTALTAVENKIPTSC